MSEYRVASRYAKSLLTLAKETSLLDELHNDMQLFLSVCQENRDFVLMLKNPVINNHKKASILKKMFKGKVHAATITFFEIITRKHREMLLPAMAEEFHNQYNLLHDIGMAKVATVFELDEPLRQEFKSLVAHYSGNSKVELEEEVDPDLIGGYLLKLEGKQVDQSLNGMLKELSLKFS
ncbi:MAG: F0F1 ATP synthase subunit delta [Cyclobacteriaceae bacterium]|nr:MAG: F0F1 ATP synthase subunit delta [Cyclobacteriaceae bacterium]